MRTRRIRTTASVSTLERLRVHGAGPDPDFRAGLRERLVAAAADRAAPDRAASDHGTPDHAAS
ncbi:hypothetical protein [Actinomadura rugatobispora]|uniref:Uncharacterized protein n=1 Tax=Actinomadura rugatobispora TaxID=1994 RepID=A0ABW1A6B6_9ACTN|nr:hypothetical protein GCM10010200_052880 [Actinomadura rugatobispora]